MIVTGPLVLGQLTETELVERLRIGAIDSAAFGAEVERREQAERRSAAARAGARRRNAEWEAAAYAQYEAVLALGWSSGLLSDAGKRKGREPWPMLWQGNEQDARLLASEEVQRYWNHIEPRVPPAGEYAAAQRAAAAEQAARQLDSIEQAGPVWEAVPGGRVAATTVTAGGRQHPAWFAVGADGSATLHRSRELAAAHLAPAEPPRPVVPPMSPGAIARYTAGLAAAGERINRTAARLEATAARIEAARQRTGRNQR